jgi:hypothetical protein
MKILVLGLKTDVIFMLSIDGTFDKVSRRTPRKRRWTQTHKVSKKTGEKKWRHDRVNKK